MGLSEYQESEILQGEGYLSWAEEGSVSGHIESGCRFGWRSRLDCAGKGGEEGRRAASGLGHQALGGRGCPSEVYHQLAYERHYD